MDNQIEERIKNIMSIVFEVSIDEIKEDSSPDNISSWDSLKHMNLIVALEDEFNIQFTDDNIVEMINMKLLVAVVTENLQN
jgi:acyl carrier protein